MRKSLLLMLLAVHFLAVKSYCQYNSLIKKELTQPDKAIGMIAHYGNEKPDYVWTEIELYKNQRFLYKWGDDMGDRRFSEGTWIKNRDTLILNSSLDSENVPVKIKYIGGDATAKRRSKIMPIENLNGSLLVLTSIFINDRSSVCVPYLDTCLGVTFQKIDSIKVSFENGLNSKWMPVTEENYKQLEIVADINFDPSQYRPIFNEKYLIKGRYLMWIIEARRSSSKGSNH